MRKIVSFLLIIFVYNVWANNDNIDDIRVIKSIMQDLETNYSNELPNNNYNSKNDLCLGSVENYNSDSLLSFRKFVYLIRYPQEEKFLPYTTNKLWSDKIWCNVIYNSIVSSLIKSKNNENNNYKNFIEEIYKNIDQKDSDMFWESLENEKSCENSPIFIELDDLVGKEYIEPCDEKEVVKNQNWKKVLTEENKKNNTNPLISNELARIEKFLDKCEKINQRNQSK